MENKIMKEMEEALIKHFLDIIVLAKLMNPYPLSGYDIVQYLHKRFNFLISSGTVYSLLYSLERKELIKGEWVEAKRVYALTEKGKDHINSILRVKEEVLRFTRALLES